jgi:hypothetical protein
MSTLYALGAAIAKRNRFLHFRNYVPHSGNRYLALKLSSNLVAGLGVETQYAFQFMRLVSRCCSIPAIW